MSEPQLSLIPEGGTRHRAQKAQRRQLDKYYTPLGAVLVLKEAQEINGATLLDPTCGNGGMADEFADAFDTILLNDIDERAAVAMPKAQAMGRRVELTAFNAALLSEWDLPPVDWIITNPPWVHASAIAEQSIRIAQRGVALLVRLSFLEVTAQRQWLRDFPPAAIFGLPRISFDGTGQTDSVIPAWFLWGPDVRRLQRPIQCFNKADFARLRMCL